jgi:PhoPQ-activated pathogenicity-related protein
MKLRLAAIVLAVLLVATAAVTLWVQPVTISIADAGKPTELTLVSRHHASKVVALHVEGSGQVDGAGEISLILNGQPYKTEKLNGPVRFSWRVDWYSPQAVVRYTPLTAKGGSVTLRYHFASP